MSKRVFDQRLEDEIRHEGVVERFLGINRDLELALKSYFHDVQIQPQHLQLPRELDLLFVTFTKRVAEEIAESRDHSARAGRVFVDERRDAVQSIEQEMRIELRAQRIQSRVGDLRVELRCFGLELRRLGL